jgi:hypothetical protein
MSGYKRIDSDNEGRVITLEAIHHEVHEGEMFYA